MQEIIIAAWLKPPNCTISAPANSNQRPVNVTINVMGNATAETVAALKQTGYQNAQRLRRVTG